MPSDASGAFNFGVDTLADVERIEVVRGPMAALYGSGAIGGVINLISRRGHEPGFHLTGELAGGYPAQVRGQRATPRVSKGRSTTRRPSRASRSAATTPRRSACRSTPACRDPYRDLIGTLNLGYTPIDGTRLSLFLRARRAVFGFDALGNPTFDNSNSTGHDDTLLGRIGVTSKLFDGTYETSAFLGRLQDDRHYTEALNPLDPNQASNDSRYHSYRTDVQWNNTVHLSDLIDVPALSATDLTFGYEHIADNINVKVNQSFVGFPFAQIGEGVDDGRRALCRPADHAAAAPDADRADPPGLGRRRRAVHLAARRGARRAGGRDPLQGRLRHRVPRALAVRPLRRRFVRLRRQSQPEAGERAGLGSRLHHHGRALQASARPTSTSRSRT